MSLSIKYMDNIKRLVTINSLHSPFFELVAIIAVANTIVLFNWLILQNSLNAFILGLHVAMQNNVPRIGQIIINM